MRFPTQSGLIAGLSLNVTSLERADPFWRAVLHPLGFGRTGSGPGWRMWARDGAQILVWESSAPARGVRVLLRAPDRLAVDRLHARAQSEAWSIIEQPAERPFGAGYYSCILADPDGIRVELVHALDDLPEREDSERVRVPGVDHVTLGGYLFRPTFSTMEVVDQERRAVIVLHGYGADARHLVWYGQELAKAGLIALCLSQRGWLGSTGDEDQGFRQPDDIVAAASWLRMKTGISSVGLLGFSQGGQTALLAAARPSSTPFGAVVSYFAPTDLAAWREQTKESGIGDYLADFVPEERMAVCSPITSATEISCPTLLLHGSNDTNVLPAQSRAMVAANSRIELQIVDGASHGFPPERWGEVWPDALSFMIRHL